MSIPLSSSDAGHRSCLPSVRALLHRSDPSTFNLDRCRHHHNKEEL